MRILEKVRKLPLKWRRIIFIISFLIFSLLISFFWIDKILKKSFFEIKETKNALKEIEGPHLREKLEEEIKHFELLLPRFPKSRIPELENELENELKNELKE